LLLRKVEQTLHQNEGSFGGQVNLRRLRDVMDGVFGYFSGTDGYLSDLVNA
jgi:hypothetical protein